MDRKTFWYGQMVDADSASRGINLAFDDVENAINCLVTDFGRDGIISGFVITEQAAPDMTVLLPPGIGFDHDGQNINDTGSNTVDLSGVSLPSAGNYKWVTIFLEHVRVQTIPWTDDSGVAGFWKNDNALSTRFVVGAEGGPTPGDAPKPSLHPNDVLAADVLMYNGMTIIVDADIDTDRMEMVGSPASLVSVDTAGWTKLSVASNNAQEVFGDIENRILNADPSDGDIDQDILPKTDQTESLGSSGQRWNARLWTAYAKSLLPDASGGTIGDGSDQFDAHLNDLTVYSSVLVDTGATVNQGTVGDPFNIITANKTQSPIADTGGPDGAVGGFVFSNNQTVGRYVPIMNALPQTQVSNPWSWAANYTFVDATARDMWYANNITDERYLDLWLPLPNGCTLNTVAIYWAQASGTVNFSVELRKHASNGTSSLISSGVIDSVGSWQTETLSPSHTVDITNGAYFLRFENQVSTLYSFGIGSVYIEYIIKDVGRCPGL